MKLFLLATAFLFPLGLCVADSAPGSTRSASSPVLEPVIMTFPQGTSIEAVKDTGKKAIDSLLSNFAASSHAPGATGFILLPLARDIDDGYFSQQFEIALTQKFADKKLKVYTRNDKTLAQIFDFAAWAQTFPEAINESTLQKLGGIVDAPAIVYPRLDISVDERGTITARANMRVIVRHTSLVPPGVSEGYAQLKAIPTNQELIRWAGWSLLGLAGLVISRKFLRAIARARRPR